MARIRRAVATCHHRGRMDRVVVLFHCIWIWVCNRDRNLASGADGEEWQVHGGGFYHVQKYLVAPEKMPDDLVWFKWESYSTWLSGFAMLILVYYLGAEFYLIDPNVLDISAWQGVLISLASLAFGWVVYDQICKSKFGDDNTRLMLLLYVILVAMAYFYTSVFSGRAALASSGCVHCVHHVGQRVLYHHAEPADRRCRS